MTIKLIINPLLEKLIGMTKQTDPTIELVNAKIVLADEAVRFCVNDFFNLAISFAVASLVDPIFFISLFTSSIKYSYSAISSTGTRKLL